MSETKNGRAALADTLEQLRMEGLAEAYSRGIKILRDDSAPATAHAQIVRIIFAAAGLGNADADVPEKDPHEMTGEELREAAERALSSLNSRGSSVMD